MPCHAYINTLDFMWWKCYLIVLYTQILSILPLCRIFSSAALSQKIEKIQERALRLLYNDSYSSYNSLLLKAEQPTIGTSHLQTWRLQRLFQNFSEFIKTWYGPECRSSIYKTRVTHITILELHTLAWMCPSGNIIPNINKQNIKRNETVVFDLSIVDLWCVLTH